VTRWAWLIDVASDPVVTGAGIVVALVLFVIAAVFVLAGGLGLFLWYRKRRLRHREMIHPDGAPNFNPVQVNQPNQP
jgi:hypothetical protein